MIDTELSNYYGSVTFEERDCGYFMCLDDWDCEQAIEITKEFYNAARKEFGNG